MIREADIWPILKFKQQWIESGSDAVFADGTRRRVFIHNVNDTRHLFVDTDAPPFYADPQKMPGFQSFQLCAEEKEFLAQKEKEQAEAETKPKDFSELQQREQQKARNYLSQRQTANRQQSLDQSDLSTRLEPLAEANRRFANEVAGSKGRRN